MEELQAVELSHDASDFAPAVASTQAVPPAPVLALGVGDEVDNLPYVEVFDLDWAQACHSAPVPQPKPAAEDAIFPYTTTSSVAETPQEADIEVLCLLGHDGLQYDKDVCARVGPSRYCCMMSSPRYGGVARRPHAHWP